MMYRSLFLIAALLFLVCSACDTASPLETDTADHVDIALRGALNAALDEGNVQIDGLARVVQAAEASKLRFSVQARADDGDKQETAQLALDLPLRDGAVPAPGRYVFEAQADDGFSGSASYVWRQTDERTSAQYRFAGERLTLSVEEAAPGRFAGRLQLHARQTDGRRTLQGQVENVQLAYDGEVQVQVIFDLALTTAAP